MVSSKHENKTKPSIEQFQPKILYITSEHIRTYPFNKGEKDTFKTTKVEKIITSTTKLKESVCPAKLNASNVFKH